jgi:hypothetical protein
MDGGSEEQVKMLAVRQFGSENLQSEVMGMSCILHSIRSLWLAHWATSK